MNPVVTRSRPARSRLSGEAGLFIAAAAAGVVLLLLVMPTLRSLRFVDVTVANPNGSTVEVEVAQPGRALSLRIGAVETGRTETFRTVIDQGDRWVFRFLSGAQDVEEILVTRSDLEDARWTVTVPDGFGT